jgi:hypothetical protein
MAILFDDKELNKLADLLGVPYSAINWRLLVERDCAVRVECDFIVEKNCFGKKVHEQITKRYLLEEVKR